MKPLLIFHINGDWRGVQHEILQNHQYSIEDVVSISVGIDGISVISEEDAEKVSKIKLAGGAGFIVGNDAMLNQQRLSGYMRIKKMGLPIVSVKSNHASVASDIRIRENVFIDHAARILMGCNIGANTWVMQGSELGSGCKVGSSCWIGRNCYISENVVIGKNCTIGDGVIIDPGVVIPEWSVLKGSGVRISKSPSNTIFLDPRFRAPVTMFHSKVS